MSRAIYVAAGRDRQTEAVAWAERARAAGWQVTSTWHDGPTLPPDDAGMPERVARPIAWRRLDELARADVVLLLPTDAMRGGCVELGYALHAGADVWVLRGAGALSAFESLGRVVSADVAGALLRGER